MALFEKDGVRYELKDENHIAAFLSNGYTEVKDAAEVDTASAVSSVKTDEKATEEKPKQRRKRTQTKR